MGGSSFPAKICCCQYALTADTALPRICDENCARALEPSGRSTGWVGCPFGQRLSFFRKILDTSVLSIDVSGFAGFTIT